MHTIFRPNRPPDCLTGEEKARAEQELREHAGDISSLFDGGD